MNPTPGIFPTQHRAPGAGEPAGTYAEQVKRQKALDATAALNAEFEARRAALAYCTAFDKGRESGIDEGMQIGARDSFWWSFACGAICALFGGATMLFLLAVWHAKG
jgi:hypothetical protein